MVAPAFPLLLSNLQNVFYFYHSPALSSPLFIIHAALIQLAIQTVFDLATVAVLRVQGVDVYTACTRHSVLKFLFARKTQDAQKDASAQRDAATHEDASAQNNATAHEDASAQKGAETRNAGTQGGTQKDVDYKTQKPPRTSMFGVKVLIACIAAQYTLFTYETHVGLLPRIY